MKNWKAIVGALGIFVLGLVAGGLIVGGLVARRMHRIRHGQPVFTVDEVTRFLHRKLDLDATQEVKVRAVVGDAQAQALEHRKGAEAQFHGVISNAVAQIRPVLRPEQQTKLDQLVAERLRR